MLFDLHTKKPVVFAVSALTIIAMFGAVMLTRDGGDDSEVLSGARQGSTAARDLSMVTILPRDAIKSIDSLAFVSPEQAATILNRDDLVIGVVIDGDARAYGVAFLTSHEIVNDTVGGKPIAVTW